MSNRLNIYICNFNTLIVVYFKRFIYKSRRSFDSNRFLGAFGTLSSSKLRLHVARIVDRFFIDLSLLITEAEKIAIVLTNRFAFLLVFIKFDWRKKLFFC